MSRFARVRRPRARIAVLATALVATAVGLSPAVVAQASPVVGVDQLDIAPNWRGLPRQQTVTAVGPTGYVHETEDPDRPYGGELEWTDFTDPAKNTGLGYDKGAVPFARSGTGGRYLYVEPGLGLHAVRDLETGTERPFDIPTDTSYVGLVGDVLLFRQGASAATGTSGGYHLVRADDPNGTRTPVTGWPTDANLEQAQLAAGDGSTAVLRFARGVDPYAYGFSDLGLVDPVTGRMTVIPAPTATGNAPVAPVALSPDRIAWIDGSRTVHIRERAALTGPERTLVLPEGLSTARIALAGDWVLALGQVPGIGASLQRKLVALHPDKPAQTLLTGAEAELTQIAGGGVAVVGGSSATDWSLLKAVPAKDGGAPVLEKLRRVEPIPAGVASLALGAGRLSTLELSTSKGSGFYARTLPVGPMHTGDPQPVWAGAETKRLRNTTPLFDSGDGRTVYLAQDDFKPLEVTARTSTGQVSRVSTGETDGRIVDAFGPRAVFTGRGKTLVVDLDAQTVVREQSQTAAALWGATLYAGTATAGEVARTDLATGKDLGKVTTGVECVPTELQAAAGRWLYWGCGPSQQRGVIDLRTGTKVPLALGTADGSLLGDGYVVDRDSASYLRLTDLTSKDSSGKPVVRRLVDSEPVSGARREYWTVDRFGGAVAYKDRHHLLHVVWPGVPTSDLTAASAKVPAGMRPQDGWKASWALSKPASIWQLTLRDRFSGNVIRSLGAYETRGRVDVSWDGRTAAGQTVVNGTYTWHLAAGTADGQGRDLSLTGTITVTGGKPAWRDMAGNDTQGDLLAMDTAGLVSLYKGNGFGGFAPRTAGTGTAFATTSVLVPYGDVDGDGCADVLARVGDQLRAYRPGCGKVVSASSPYTLIGSGWGQYDVLTSPGDANGDGFTDLIARQTSTGDMYFYAGTADHRVKSRVRIGTNWKLYKKIVGAGDINRDGRGDLLGVDADGGLWRYYGTATGGVTARVKIGTGWGIYSSVAGVGDISGDGCPDLVGRDSAGRLYSYDATCGGAYRSRFLIGGGWNAFKSLF